MDKTKIREMVLLDPFDVFPREMKRVISRNISKERDAQKEAEKQRRKEQELQREYERRLIEIERQMKQDKQLAKEIWAEDRRLQKLESMNEHFSNPEFADRHTLIMDDSEWRDKYQDQYLWLISE